MTAARPSKRNASAMGKRLAQHVMMHAGETARIHLTQTLGRETVAKEGAVDDVEQFMRQEMVQAGLKNDFAVVGWRKFEYAVTFRPKLDEEEHEPRETDWKTDRPGIQDMELDAVLQIRLTGYGVPVLEVP